ncbi:hypothetical protein B0H14DRAFT_3666257 [Mycena olivaceomarginata]|nr:hypothetical protein B0H14DRAFT_3666257 [Mycena olivaceomarginata]
MLKKRGTVTKLSDTQARRVDTINHTLSRPEKATRTLRANRISKYGGGIAKTGFWILKTRIDCPHGLEKVLHVTFSPAIEGPLAKGEIEAIVGVSRKQTLKAAAFVRGSVFAPAAGEPPAAWAHEGAKAGTDAAHPARVLVGGERELLIELVQLRLVQQLELDGHWDGAPGAHRRTVALYLDVYASTNSAARSPPRERDVKRTRPVSYAGPSSSSALSFMPYAHTYNHTAQVYDTVHTPGRSASSVGVFGSGSGSGSGYYRQQLYSPPHSPLPVPGTAGNMQEDGGESRTRSARRCTISHSVISRIRHIQTKMPSTTPRISHLSLDQAIAVLESVMSRFKFG